MTESTGQQRDPSLWGISWSGRMHRLGEPVDVTDPKRMYATSRCGSSVYLRGFLADGAAASPHCRSLLGEFDSAATPVCKLCARRSAA